MYRWQRASVPHGVSFGVKERGKGANTGDFHGRASNFYLNSGRIEKYRSYGMVVGEIGRIGTSEISVDGL